MQPKKPLSCTSILYLRTDLGTAELQGGGSVTHTLGVLEGLQGLNVKVICASSAMLPVLCSLPWLEVHVLSLPRWLAWCRYKVSCLVSSLVFACSVLFKYKKYTFEYVYQRYSALNVTGVLLSRWYNAPLILEFNGSEVWVDQHWSSHTLFKMQRLMQWIEDTNCRFAFRIVVVSQVLKDQLIARSVNAGKIVVAPNGVNPALFDAQTLAPARLAGRQIRGLQERFVIGFIGSFGPWHGVEMLAQVIPRICALDKRAHFLLIGDGPLRAMLEQAVQTAGLTSQHVTFTGTIAHHAARDYLAMCDAFICPTQPNPDGSRFFGSPTKLFEYMSMAKPIIASDIEQVREIIDPAWRVNSSSLVLQDSQLVVGFLVPPLDIDAFVLAITYMMNLSVCERERIGYAAREKVQRLYTWTEHTKTIFNSL